jgi:hypothetical protein
MQINTTNLDHHKNHNQSIKEVSISIISPKNKEFKYYFLLCSKYHKKIQYTIQFHLTTHTVIDLDSIKTNQT